MTAIDRELIAQHPELPEDKFVVRHGTQTQTQTQTGGSSAGAAGGGGSGAPTEAGSRVAHFYLQVLAESFAKDLPGARRGEEQLSALAGEPVGFFRDIRVVRRKPGGATGCDKKLLSAD